MSLLFLLPGMAMAQDAPESATLTDVNTLWMCLAAFLVFFMQAGFALVECGFTRAKNACNIIMKNVMDFSIGTLAFWMVGFGLMFGATSSGFFGTTNFFFDAGDNNFNWAFLIFQTVFCATAATIVSGAMAERTKFIAYLCYTVCITVIVYPIFGSWAWGGLLDGGGWLEELGFYDFAGSTVVHSVGGWCALAGAIVIGPRLGKYSKDGKTQAIPGHNIPLAALGVFILWLGWFGFNPGSTAVGGGSFAYIAVTTNLAAAAGAIAATIASWVLFKKPDTSFALNGALAGLVAITAGCDGMSPMFAIITGFAGGLLVVGSVLFFDKLKIDDPVGAISVHGVCGVWGTLAIGLFHKDAGLLLGGGTTQIIAQLVGIGAAFVWAFGVSFVIFTVIKHTIGLRVSEADEMEGLDIAEHGMHAYPPHLITEGLAGTPLAPAMALAKPSPAADPVPNPSPEGT
jgi:Amt family ammonium transporter